MTTEDHKTRLSTHHAIRAATEHSDPRTAELRHRPHQKRALRTVNSIQQACLAILETEGESALNTNRIAEAAEISIGTLYRYFPNKEAIVDTVLGELMAGNLEHSEVISEHSIQLARRSLRDTIDYIVTEEIARHRRILHSLRSFYLDIHWRHDFHQYVAARMPHRVLPETWLQRVLDKYAHELRVADTQMAAELIVDVMSGTIHSVLSRRPDYIFDDRFGQELVALVMRYLKA